MFLTIAAALFAAFTINIVFSAQGGTSPINDVGELLLLLSATIAFVVAILQAEKKRAQSEL